MGQGDRDKHRTLGDELNEEPEDNDKSTVQEDMVRYTADIPTSLHRRLKVQAALEDRPMREVAIDALDDHLVDNVSRFADAIK